MSLFTHNAESCFKAVGKSDVDAALATLAPLLSELAGRKHTQATPLLKLPSRNDDLASIETLAADIRKNFSNVVVVGSGGSSLSGRTLSEFKPNRLLHFLENIDPDAIESVLEAVDLKTTCFIVISKSGGTVETLGQFYVLYELAKQALGSKAASHFIVITQSGNPLHDTASKEGMHVLAHENDIGGRFSIFTNVGLLPGALAGCDIRALREGAQSVVRELEAAKTPEQNLPALGASLQYALMQKGRNISVMLPYAQRLSGFSSWYRQGWAESLGKSGKGSTPIRAVGSTDQHSQLQLYLDGPKDKLFHLITVKRAGQGHKVNAPAKELAYMHGKTTGDILAAEQKATYETLISNGCPVRHFEMEKLTEKELGALLMHFMLEIIFMSKLIGVNPFDQPAVEDGKRLARDYLLSGKL